VFARLLQSVLSIPTGLAEHSLRALHKRREVGIEPIALGSTAMRQPFVQIRTRLYRSVYFTPLHGLVRAGQLIHKVLKSRGGSVLGRSAVLDSSLVEGTGHLDVEAGEAF
jgi:hypothetical protein